MMRRAIAGLLILTACHPPAPATVAPSAALNLDLTSLQGRWVQEGTMVAYHVHGDSAEVVMFPPQGMKPLPWRARAGILEISRDTLERHAYSIRNDTLSMDWNAPGGRLVLQRMVAPRGPAEIEGSWRTMIGQQPSIFNFRSDGKMILEVGVPAVGRMRGDTLVISPMGSDLKLVLKRVGAGMQAVNVEMPSRTIRLTRRPWGCFGFKQIDLDAKECR